MKLVFVCKHGQHRSAIAAQFAVKYAKEYGKKVSVDYFGVSSDLTTVEQNVILDDADMVYVMDNSYLNLLKGLNRYYGPAMSLDIADDDNARSILEKKVEHIISEL